MSKKIDFQVSESLEYLRGILKQEKNYRIVKRLQFLILKEDPKYKTREDLASYLNINESSLRSWSKTYIKSGLDSLLTISSGGATHTKISLDLHQILEEKLNNSTDPFLSYTQAVHWIKEEKGIEIKYNTLRTYMKRHFGTKLKVPRKSHYKKDEQAITVFKKPSI